MYGEELPSLDISGIYLLLSQVFFSNYGQSGD